MRALLFAIIFSIVPTVYSQQAVVVVNGCPQGLPVRCGPGADCPVTAVVFQQTKSPLYQCCEKIDSNGTVWAKIVIKGWVKSRNGNTRNLRRLMTRDHEWEVLPCRESVVMCTGMSRSDQPVCKLQPCTVITKSSHGLPNCGYIHGCFSGWVVKECRGRKFLCDLR